MILIHTWDSVNCVLRLAWRTAAAHARGRKGADARWHAGKDN